jgi:carbon monoxide dehydrogenase subunit G
VITVQADTVVNRPAEDILEFVMDAERYRQADHKLWRVRSVERTGNEAVVRMIGRARGMPMPTAQRMVLTPGRSIEVRNLPSWQDRFMDFTGTFRCDPVDGGTRVTHRYVFDFRGPLRPVAERFLASWLDEDIHAEVGRLKDLLEAGGDR